MPSLTYNDIGLYSTQLSTILSRTECSTRFFGPHCGVLNLPVIAAPMDTVCGYTMVSTLKQFGMLGILHRAQTIEQQAEDFRHLMQQDGMPELASVPLTPLGVAVGVTGDYKERVLTLLDIFNNSPQWDSRFLVLCFDTANGHHILSGDAIRWLRSRTEFKADRMFIMAGNVATAQGYSYLGRCGADMVRVGIGSGGACTTSIATGMGRGMVTAIQHCHNHAANSIDRPLIIADGGIKGTGDVMKALAVGADLAMAGSLFAGFDQSNIPEDLRRYQGNKVVRPYRGMASFDASEQLGKSARSAEGITTEVPYKGDIVPFLHWLHADMQSALAYCDAKTLRQFKQNVEWEELTPASYHERTPHTT